MPLSETNKTQSQSIEDLIAQLDAPQAKLDNGTSQPQSNGIDIANRKTLKGKRTNSTSSGNGSGSFVKTNSFGQNSEPVLSKNIIVSKKYSKHMGKLRHAGNPKKNGSGGKHTWGAPGCELGADDYLDTRDPNYDSEEGGNVVMVCVENSDGAQSGGGCSKSSGKNRNKTRSDDDGDYECANGQARKELDVDDLDAEIKPVILEYFHNGDTIEVIDQFKCYKFSKIKPVVISYLIQISLENNNTCKELMSRLLRDLTFELFAEKDFSNGFDLLLKNLPDLTLDNPDAPEKTGTFIARAIADKVITRAYLDRFFNDGENNVNLPDLNDERVYKAIDSARLLLTMNDHLYQLSHIWGQKGGFLPVKELSDKMNEIIIEYHDSGDIEEAIRCLKELNVPHFNHEFVFEAVDFALQKGTDNAFELIENLLHRLCQSVVVTYDQLKMGFTRIIDILPDISLDVPNASSLVDKFLSQCHEKGFVSKDIVEMAPNRSRKRFVSEGDGGRIKD